MATKNKQEAQNPLILRCQRLSEAFAKSDDERDFYLDRLEGFIVYVDLDKTEQDLKILEKELQLHNERYCMIPKLTFYETKKIMEGFVNEKVYDIDTKEKLLDIIQSKEARENFLEFIYDHHTELEKWQLYYQERSRIRIIEWLRNNHFHFVFEEDLEMPKSMIEKLKRDLFQTKVGKDVLTARKALAIKAKTYYSNEALNPRPKRGRPPKQAAKLEIEHQVSTDIYTTVPNDVRMFLFTPDYTSSSSVTFSSKFESEEELLASRKAHTNIAPDMSMESLNLKLASLRSISSRWLDTDSKKNGAAEPATLFEDSDVEIGLDEEDVEEEEDFDGALASQASTVPLKKKPPINGSKPSSVPSKPKSMPKTSKKAVPPTPAKIAKPASKQVLQKKAIPQKTKPKPVAPKKPQLRSIIKPKKLTTTKGKANTAKPTKMAKIPAKNPTKSGKSKR